MESSVCMPAEVSLRIVSERRLKVLSRYRQPRIGRSGFELLVTVVPFAAFWACASISLFQGFWLGLISVVPASAFLLRLFMIQHDCGHGSFSRPPASRRLDRARHWSSDADPL